MKNAAAKQQAREAWLYLETEAENNGNVNFIIDRANYERGKAKAEFLQKFMFEELGDVTELGDYDDAWCCLFFLIEEMPSRWPASADEGYQAARRVLESLGVFDEAEGN